MREAKNLVKHSKVSDLAWTSRSLSTKELGLVWKAATDEEKLSLQPVLRGRVTKRQEPADRKLLVEMVKGLRAIKAKKNENPTDQGTLDEE
jgi:hypothetical protein